MTETLFVAVLFGEGPCQGILPDFALMASGDTTDEVLLQLQKLAAESVEVSKRFGVAIPNATSEATVKSRWRGDKYQFADVVVRV